MEWVKRRVFEFRQEDPCHTEVEHVCFFRLRSDGTMWYQLSRLSMAAMEHRLLGGWLFDKWQRFLVEETKVPKVSVKEFDREFVACMRHMHGVEVEMMFKNE